jgi:hypothetical protein
MSRLLPGGAGTTILTGWVGQAWAAAGPASPRAARAARVQAVVIRLRRCMVAGGQWREDGFSRLPHAIKARSQASGPAGRTRARAATARARPAPAPAPAAAGPPAVEAPGRGPLARRRLARRRPHPPQPPRPTPPGLPGPARPARCRPRRHRRRTRRTPSRHRARPGRQVDRARRHRHAFQRAGHVIDPDRKRQAAAGLALAQAARLAVAHPRHRHHARLEAGEPRVHRVVGGAGLAVEVGALQRGLGARGGAAARGRRCQHGGHEEDVARRDRARGLVLRRRGRRLEQHLALRVDDALDQHRADHPAAVGDGAIGLRHLHRRDAAGAQGQGQVGRLARRVEPVAAEPVARGTQPHLLQHAHADQVARARQGVAQRHRAVEAVVRVLPAPSRWQRHEGRVVDHACRASRPLQRGGIQKGLIAEPGWRQRLGDVVEGWRLKSNAAHQRAHAAGGGVQRTKAASACGHCTAPAGVLARRASRAPPRRGVMASGPGARLQRGSHPAQASRRPP